ncbi:MAG: HTH domain-containing protein [Candidatus Pacearchaeota archaeon]|nr:HTH domain-containing protein [Candidatus Pacearchaeota archaeon]
MAKKPKELKKVIVRLGGEEKSFFTAVFRPLPFQQAEPVFSAKQFRQLLSDEKARILHTLRVKRPISLYALAKALGRDFKAVRQDVKLLEKFGLIRLVSEFDKNTKKKRLKPVLGAERLFVRIEI